MLHKLQRQSTVNVSCHTHTHTHVRTQAHTILRILFLMVRNLPVYLFILFFPFLFSSLFRHCDKCQSINQIQLVFETKVRGKSILRFCCNIVAFMARPNDIRHGRHKKMTTFRIHQHTHTYPKPYYLKSKYRNVNKKKTWKIERDSDR